MTNEEKLDRYRLAVEFLRQYRNDEKVLVVTMLKVLGEIKEDDNNDSL